MHSITVKAAAKLNLTLQITGLSGKLHTLDMLCCSVNLYETVTLTKATDITLSCNVKSVPTDAKNTAYRMAQVFFDYTKINGGVTIAIDKTVPIGAGMGGGSADAAAVLKGLDLLYNTKLSADTMISLGLMVGSDLPVCLTGGLCRVGGTGGDIEVINKPLPYFFVAVMGGESVSTAEAYRRYDEMLTDDKADTSDAINRLGTDSFFDAMKNDLEYSSVLNLAAIKDEFYSLGAAKAMMTGSGAAVYGLFKDEKTAKNAADNIFRPCYLLKPCADGVEILG